MAKTIEVAVLTHAGGAHVGAYLSGLAETEECSAVVLADPDGNWREEAARVLGGKLKQTYGDYRELLATERPAMALVTMEAKVAPPVIDAALEADCHVFAEKPACVRGEDFVPLVQKADSKHRYLMLALANRVRPEVQAAVELIRSTQLGRLYGVEVHLIADQTRLTRTEYQKTWYADRDRAGGGHLIWLGIHWLDLAMFLSGAGIEQVAGMTANIGGQPINAEDSAVATLRFGNDMLGTMTSGYYLDRGYHSHLKIWGSAGWLHLEHMEDRPLHWYSTKGEKAGVVQTWDGPKTPHSYTPFVRAAVQACANDTEPPITNAESLRALQTVFAIYEAADTGRAVIVG